MKTTYPIDEVKASTLQNMLYQKTKMILRGPYGEELSVDVKLRQLKDGKTEMTLPCGHTQIIDPAQMSLSCSGNQGCSIH